jgi:hypothetical protein
VKISKGAIVDEKEKKLAERLAIDDAISEELANAKAKAQVISTSGPTAG